MWALSSLVSGFLELLHGSATNKFEFNTHCEAYLNLKNTKKDNWFNNSALCLCWRFFFMLLSESFMCQLIFKRLRYIVNYRVYVISIFWHSFGFYYNALCNIINIFSIILYNFRTIIFRKPIFVFNNFKFDYLFSLFYRLFSNLIISWKMTLKLVKRK